MDPTCLMARMQLDVVRTLRSASGESESMRSMQTRAQKQQREPGKSVHEQNDAESWKSDVHASFVGADRKGVRESTNQRPSPGPSIDSVSGSSRDAATLASVARTRIPSEATTLPHSNYASNAPTPLPKQQRQQQQALASDAVGIDITTVEPARQGQAVSGGADPWSDSQNDALEKAMKLFKERTEQGDAPEDCPTDINMMVKDKRWNVRAYGYDSLAYLLTTDASQLDGIDLVDVVSRGLADINAPAQVHPHSGKTALIPVVLSGSCYVHFEHFLNSTCMLI